jgi:hypothetical protein
MASTYTGLGTQLMATGENAGTWGTKTNTNLNIIEQIAGGFIEVDINGGAQTTTLAVSDGATGAALANRVIKFTGAITGNQIVTIPLDVETFYLVDNATTGSYTVQFKYVSGSDSGVTWAATDKGNKIIYADAEDATNPALVDFGMGTVTLTGTETLTNKTLTLPVITSISNSGTVTIPTGADTLVNLASAQTLTTKTLTSPKIGTDIQDTNGKELVKLTATTDAVNEFTIANAATGNGPTLSATGETNVDINITPKATGKIALDGIKWPNADGSADQIMTTNGSGVLSFVDNSGGTSWQAVKTSGFTAAAGEGYWCNTGSAAFTVTLPTGVLGSEITLVDYGGDFDSNNLTVTPASGEKIQGGAADATLTVAVERAGFTLVYTDGTEGWLLKDK